MNNKLTGYDVILTKITKAEIDQYHGKNYLCIETQSDLGHQNYPACNIKNLDEAIDYFNETMDIKRLEDINNKEVYAISNFSSIIGLINKETNQIFSLQAHFFPELYKEDVYAIASKNSQHDLLNMPLSDALLLAVITSINPKTTPPELIEKSIKIITSKVFSEKLDNVLATKDNEIVRLKI